MCVGGWRAGGEGGMKEETKSRKKENRENRGEQQGTTAVNLGTQLSITIMRVLHASPSPLAFSVAPVALYPLWHLSFDSSLTFTCTT